MSSAATPETVQTPQRPSPSPKGRRIKILLAVVAFLVVEVLIGRYADFDMSKVGQPPAKLTHVFGWQIPLGGIATRTVVMSALVSVLLCWWAVSATRRMSEKPGRLQATAELFVQAFLDLCNDTLGSRGRAYMPFVATIFLFVWISNMLGVIPGLEEPTRNINTTLGLGIICFIVAHVSSIRAKGIKSYILDYFEPMIVVKGVSIPNVFMFPLNFVGELSKVISHSFRLFGNIMGGAIIIMVVSNLTHYVAMPILLSAFFGLFVGTVQAFVFAMLALTYIAVLQPQEE